MENYYSTRNYMYFGYEEDWYRKTEIVQKLYVINNRRWMFHFWKRNNNEPSGVSMYIVLCVHPDVVVDAVAVALFVSTESSCE